MGSPFAVSIDDLLSGLYGRAFDVMAQEEANLGETGRVDPRLASPGATHPPSTNG